MPSREQLAEFTAWCQKHITGDEKGQAQIFLDRLFQAFGQPGCLDVGGTTEFRVRKASEDGGGTAFADYVWKPIVLIEMKKRGENLQKHYRQAFDYWSRLVPNRPRYVVLCNFDEFRIYDFDTDIDTPKDTLALKDLPDRYGPLTFLAPGSPKPTFENDREQVTRQAADCLAECFRKLIQRGVPRETAQRFILQMLVALFAEDIDLLPKYFVTQVLEDCMTPASAYDLIGGLFAATTTSGGGNQAAKGRETYELSPPQRSMFRSHGHDKYASHPSEVNSAVCFGKPHASPVMAKPGLCQPRRRHGQILTRKCSFAWAGK